jgi:hypothetical protein
LADFCDFVILNDVTGGYKVTGADVEGRADAKQAVGCFYLDEDDSRQGVLLCVSIAVSISHCAVVDVLTATPILLVQFGKSYCGLLILFREPVEDQDARQPCQSTNCKGRATEGSKESSPVDSHRKSLTHGVTDDSARRCDLGLGAVIPLNGLVYHGASKDMLIIVPDGLAKRRLFAKKFVAKRGRHWAICGHGSKFAWHPS